LSFFSVAAAVALACIGCLGAAVLRLHGTCRKQMSATKKEKKDKSVVAQGSLRRGLDVAGTSSTIEAPGSHRLGPPHSNTTATQTARKLATAPTLKAANATLEPPGSLVGKAKAPGSDPSKALELQWTKRREQRLQQRGRNNEKRKVLMTPVATAKTSTTIHRPITSVPREDMGFKKEGGLHQKPLSRAAAAATLAAGDAMPRVVTPTTAAPSRDERSFIRDYWGD